MLIKTTPRWAIPERDATPEAIFRQRRALLKSAGAAAAVAMVPGAAHANIFDRLLGKDTPTPDNEVDPSADLYPAPRNEAYQVLRPMTDENLATTYNNFYEFGSHKRIFDAAQALDIRPWTVEIAGLVGKPQVIDIDDLLRSVQLEERVYRLRCVEAWSMVVPWTGFPLSEIVRRAEPQSGARFLKMETFYNPEVAPGQRASWQPWPYVEALTLEEATNPLAFLATGAYGKPLEEQMGAPLRLAVPWKYGFKSGKSLVRFTFTDTMPTTFWMEVGPEEYGFWANVNPEVPHRRWSQATERPLGNDDSDRIPTLLYNGYADEVAGLYAAMDGQRIFY